ncbi:MAG TPA: acyltransferase, partial [Cytophagaceae bacterium]
MVALSHLAELSQVKEFQVFDVYLSAPAAVHGFFVISGFLIFRSYERSPEWRDYLRRRFRRILPAYIAVVVICALFLFIISEYAPGTYFMSFSWWKYLIANLLTLNFLQPELPGVFQQNYIHAVNGSLWTIKVELSFYLLLPVLVYFLQRVNKKFGVYILLALLFLSIAYTEILTLLYENNGNKIYLVLQRQLPGQLSFFIMGILFYKYFDKFVKHKNTIGIVSVLLILFDLIWGIGWLASFSLPGLILWIAFSPAPVFSFLDNHDYSYGIYLWHFPLIQLFTDQHWFDENPWLMFFIFMTTVAGVSALSWYCLERRFIQKKNKRVSTAVVLSE